MPIYELSEDTLNQIWVMLPDELKYINSKGEKRSSIDVTLEYDLPKRNYVLSIATKFTSSTFITEEVVLNVDVDDVESIIFRSEIEQLNFKLGCYLVKVGESLQKAFG